MKLMKGDMFADSSGPVFFTANSVISAKGELVMGKGVALQAKTLYPSLPYVLGGLVDKFPIDEEQGERFYGVVYVDKMMHGNVMNYPCRIGAFQTKFHWRDGSCLGLVQRSAFMLSGVSRVMGTVNVNFPGVGNGGLDRKDVLEIIEDVWSSDDIIVWET